MFQRTRHGAIDVVLGDGPLTHAQVEDLCEAIRPSLQDGQPRTVLVIQDVPLVDSQGLEALLDLQEQAEQLGGSIRIAGPTALCQEILDVTGVGSRFEIYADTRSAVRSFIQ